MDIKIGNWYYVKGCNRLGEVLSEGFGQAVQHTAYSNGARFLIPGRDKTTIVYSKGEHPEYPFDEIKPASKLHRYLFNGE
jgi:hypothetical protein